MTNIAFHMPFGFYGWLVMPFGLTGTLAYFVDLMNHVFKGQLKKFVLMFIDDILVYLWIEEEQKSHLRIVLEVLIEHQLKEKSLKCHF